MSDCDPKHASNSETFSGIWNGEMTDKCTSPEGHDLEIIYDVIGVNSDGDDAYVYLGRCARCKKQWLDFELSDILNAHASLTEKVGELRETISRIIVSDAPLTADDIAWAKEQATLLAKDGE